MKCECFMCQADATHVVNGWGMVEHAELRVCEGHADEARSDGADEVESCEG